MRHTAAVILAACAAFGMLGGCGGGGGDDPPDPPANLAPLANAGAAQSVTSGATVTLNGSASSDADGSIAGYAWTQTAGPGVTLNSATVAQPTFTAPVVTSAATLTFSLVVTDNRGAPSTAAMVSITVNPPAGDSVTITGRVRYERPPFLTGSPFGLNYAAPVLQPVRGVVVRALNAATTSVIQGGVTDLNGNYSFTVPGNTQVAIQVEARLLRDATQPLPRWNVRVQDGTAAGGAPYAYVGAAFNSSVGTQDLLIPMNISPAGVATGVRHSGPFAILDTIRTAIDAVVAVSPAALFPDLSVNWGPGADGSFFSPGAQRITLRADLTEDTEEFDPHVVAHEFGHYIEHNFSRSDSIGGPHALGDRLDMRVAFGEGFGYAFAAIVLNDPVARDSFVFNGQHVAGGFNVENNPGRPGYASDPTGCWCSESSVWSILWDLFDPPNGDPLDNDALQLGFQPLWDVLTGPQRTTPAFTSIFTFIEALKDARPAQAAAIDALVSAQNITSSTANAFATTEANAPAPDVLPLYTDIGLGTPVVVRTSDDAGLYNKIGNRRFLRFVAPSTRSVNITVTSSNPDPQADPDFLVFSNGTLRAVEWDPPPGPETTASPLAVVAGQTYLIDAYDCANGCQDVEENPQGTPGDYDLTVSIN